MAKNSILKNYTSAIAWFSFLFIGLSGTIYFAPRVAGYLYNSGPQTIAFFIAPFCACTFFVLICLYKRPSLLNLLVSLLLLVIIYIPLYKTWNQQYELAYKSDNFLYYRAARYMVQHASLNSRDNLLLNVKAGNQYLYQPGYKYYLGLLLLPSDGKLVRQVQFIGIFLFTFCNLLALYKIAGSTLQSRVKTSLLFFFLLVIPAAINNIMDGLTEGLFISVFLLFFFFYKNKNFVICSVLLALSVFIRQNFLIAAIPLLLLVMINTPTRWICLIVFLFVLLMPFYYNYYYAGQVRFFADYSWMTQKYRVGENWVYETLIRPNQLATLYYIGFAHLSARIVLLGLLFIPLGFALTLLIFYKTWKMNPLIGILFFLISLLLIWPTLGYMGAAGYPRFQMVNYSVIIIAYLILADSKEKFISKHRGNH